MHRPGCFAHAGPIQFNFIRFTMPPIAASATHQTSTSETIYADISPEPVSPESESLHGNQPSPESYRPGGKTLNYSEIEFLKSPDAGRRFTPASRADTSEPADSQAIYARVERRVDNGQRKKTPPPVAPREGPSAPKAPAVPLRRYELADGMARAQLDDLVRNLVSGFATSTPRGLNPFKQKETYGATAATNALVAGLTGDGFSRVSDALDGALGRAANEAEVRLKRTCLDTAMADSVRMACTSLTSSQKAALQRHMKADLLTQAAEKAEMEMIFDSLAAGGAREAFLKALTAAAR